MTFLESIRAFPKIPKTPVFDHSNYRLFERIPAVPGTSNKRGLTVYGFSTVRTMCFCPLIRKLQAFEILKWAQGRQ